MCILCVASRWSRRIVTMLPWLIIPLIILWALSQLLPPGFRFEVTSPRLACVGVLLISLGWYELAMPRLSMWRAKRSALQRERRRIEAQEAAKWRKEATRRCRNCYSAYRDQTPGGGKFMCTFCGHISKRPVLDFPGGPEGMTPSGPMPAGGIQTPNGAGSAGSFPGPRSSRGWAWKGWPDKGGWVPGGKGWTSTSKGWAQVGGGGATWGGSNGSWGPTNWSGKGWTNTGTPYWGGGSAGGNWGGSGYGGGGFFGSESCGAGDSHHGGLFYALLQSVSFIFFCLKWVWRKLWRRERHGEDGSPSGGRRGVGQRKGEDSGIPQGSRGDKARRKAEEKRQARLEREQLEAEERRQREEVARLVEERRRLRDEKLEAEKESERGAAAERERELRREREAERRRHDKVRDKEKEQAKEKPRDNTDSEDSKKKKEKKDVDNKKPENEKRAAEAEKKGSPVQNGDLRKATKGSRGTSVDSGHKAADNIAVKVGGKVGNSRHIGLGKGTGSVPPKVVSPHQNNTSFWGKGLTSGKSANGHTPAVSTPVTVGSSTLDVANGKPSDTSYSTWNRMPWTKVWGKSSTSSAEDNGATPPTGSPNVNRRIDATKQNGVKSGVNGSSGGGVSDLSHSFAEVKQSTAAPSQPRSWQRLFSNSNSSAVAPSPPSDMDSRKEYPQKVDPAPHAAGNVYLDTENAICFGRGLHGSPIAKQTEVAPVGPPVHVPPLSFAPMSSPSITSGLTTSAFTPVLGASPFAPPPPSVPAPISKPAQLPVHPPVSSPLHMPAPIQMPVLMNRQNQSHVPQDQLPQILDPWGQPPVSVNDSAEGAVGDKWQMWDSPQLSSIAEPLNSWNYSSSGFLEQPKDSLRPPTKQQPLEPENQLPASLFSPHPLVDSGYTSGDVLGTLPACNSQSLWSGNSAMFESAMRAWDDSDSHQRVPPEFLDCITHEVMKDPVISADGHSYEREAIERWLKTHDTSPITGEVLPPPQGGYGSGVDKSLRPNHILRGQIIEYRESMARVRGSLQDSNRDSYNWSVGFGLGGSAWSTDRSQIGGLYSTPGVQSVWSYNGSQNSQNPVLPLI